MSSSLTVHPNLALVLEIAFVSNEHHRKVILILDPKDLLMELVDLLERLSSGYRVNEDEPFSGAHVLFAHRPIGEKGDIRQRTMGRWGIGKSERERER